MPTSNDTRTSISVVVPVYNSELILPALIKRLEPVLTGWRVNMKWCWSTMAAGIKAGK